MARSSRFKTNREESSKGHKLVGEILHSLFPIGKIYQEYPYDLILKKGYNKQGVTAEFWNNTMIQRAKKFRADWVVLDKNLVVEYQGEHHFSPVDYGDGKGGENYAHRIYLDTVKRRILIEAGFKLIEWPHYEQLTEESLALKIEEVFAK